MSSPSTPDDALLVDDDLVAMTCEVGIADQLYPVFYAELRRGVAELLAAIDAGDRREAARLAHRLRGSSIQVGARRLPEVLGAIEHDLVGGEGVGAAEAVSSLESLVTATIGALERALAALRGRG